MSAPIDLMIAISHTRAEKRRCSCGCLSTSLLVPCFLLTQTLKAYEVPLSPASVHEAYVLGQRNDKATADFEAPYINQVTEADGPYRADIQILTPYSHVVDQSGQNTSGYSEQQAIKDYHQRGDIVVVRVLLTLPAAYPRQEKQSGPAVVPCENTALRPEHFWQNFQFIVKQHGKVLASRSFKNQPIYSSPTKDAAAVLDGATVWLEYDAHDVASEATIVEILTPDCKTIRASFDLKKLR